MGNGQTDPIVQVELTGLANGWEAGVRGRQETNQVVQGLASSAMWKVGLPSSEFVFLFQRLNGKLLQDRDQCLVNFICYFCCYITKSCLTLWPHGLQHARLLCPPLSPGICSNSCPLTQWCHLTISSSAGPFSICFQSFPGSGSFLMNLLFASGGQSIGASASAPVLPMNIQGLFPLGLTGWFDLLAFQGTPKCLLQHHSSKASILWQSAFFMVQLSHPYTTTRKIIALIM